VSAPTYIEPGSPWENPFVESLNGPARDDLLNVEDFDSLTKARVAVEPWRIEYNTYRPHSLCSSSMSTTSAVGLPILLMPLRIVADNGKNGQTYRISDSGQWSGVPGRSQ